MATSATHSPIRLPVLTPAGVLILIVPEIDLTDEGIRARLARDVTPRPERPALLN